MTEWTKSTLGEVATISIGRTPPRADARYWTADQTHPFCTIADMKHRIVKPVGEGVTDLAISEGKAKMFPAGSLMMSFKLSIGRIGFAAQDLFPNEAIARLQTDSAVLSETYLALVLESQDLSEGAGRAVKGKTLNRESLRAIPVSYPSLPMQVRAEHVVNAVDRVVDALDAEFMAASLVLDALRDQLMESDIQPLSSVLTTARAGGTPDRSRSDYYSGSIPWLKSGEVASPWIASTSEFLTEVGLAESAAWLVPAETVVVAMYGATAAQVGYLGTPAATNQAVLALVADPSRADSRFLYHWMCARSSDLKKSATGAAQPNLSKGVVLAEAGFPKMSLEEQEAWVARLDAVTGEVSALKDEMRALNVLRLEVVRALTTGEFQIPSTFDDMLEEAM